MADWPPLKERMGGGQAVATAGAAADRAPAGGARGWWAAAAVASRLPVLLPDLPGLNLLPSLVTRLAPIALGQALQHSGNVLVPGRPQDPRPRNTSPHSGDRGEKKSSVFSHSAFKGCLQDTPALGKQLWPLF